MKKIIVGSQQTDTIQLNEVDRDTPIFAKKKGRLEGMLVKEKEGWIFRMGGEIGFSGYHDKREDCIRRAVEGGYEFFIED